MTETFRYDALNRQVSRTVGGVTTFNVWDGWDLIEEYQGNGTIVGLYTYGPGGLVFSGSTQRSTYWAYHYQDGAGSTSHIADTSGNLLEWYRYDLQGTPFFYAPNDTQRSTTNYSVRHLFTGQQWYSDIGLYDLRNRFYSPDIGRFLQPDPIGHRGGSNLYRYCGNNPVTRWDPSGLDFPPHPAEAERVTVPGDPIPGGWSPGGVLGGGYPMGGGSGEPGLGGRNNSDNPKDHLPFTPPEDIPIPLPPPLPEIPALEDSNTNSASSSGSPTQAQITSQVLQVVIVTFSTGTQTMPMTLIKNDFQAAILRRPKFSRVPIFVPPGIDPQAIVNRWAGTTFPSNMPAFYKAFNPWNGSMNFKAISPIFDSFGNYIYGWSGTVGGYPAILLQGVGQATHLGFNNEINVYDINLGIEGAMMDGTIRVVPVSDSDF